MPAGFGSAYAASSLLTLWNWDSWHTTVSLFLATVFVRKLETHIVKFRIGGPLITLLEICIGSFHTFCFFGEEARAMH
eukprot:scaffold94815_cov14-Tisochrysis_lutea.AAC.1